MDIQLDSDSKIRLSKDVSLSYMLKLDPESLKNLCQSSSKYRQFCHRTEIWKLFFQRDFKDFYLPTYLNEPDWMKVYFWYTKLKLLKDKLNLIPSPNQANGFINIFSDTHSGTSSNTNIIGSLIALGLNFQNKFSLVGSYLNIYSFNIGLDKDNDLIVMNTELAEHHKFFSKLIRDLRKYLLMIPPLNYTIYVGSIYQIRDISWDLFSEKIPNSQYHSPYEFLYLPSLTISTDILTPNLGLQFINKHILISPPHILHIPPKYTPEKFFEFPGVATLRKQGKVYKYTLGCFHGTPFVITYSLNIYTLYCPATNIQPLIQAIDEYLNTLDN